MAGAARLLGHALLRAAVQEHVLDALALLADAGGVGEPAVVATALARHDAAHAGDVLCVWRRTVAHDVANGGEGLVAEGAILWARAFGAQRRAVKAVPFRGHCAFVADALSRADIAGGGVRPAVGFVGALVCDERNHLNGAVRPGWRVLARGGKAGELVRVRKVRALQRHKGGVKQHGVGIASEWLGHKEELC